jgi:hypothetical protein
MSFLKTHTMRIDIKEAAFLAALFDAALIASAKQKKNVTDFVTAQAFMGNDVNPENLSEKELLQQMEVAEHEMICLRSRLHECFGL